MRPEGWEEVINENCSIDKGPGFYVAGFEAGADAYEKGLKKEGYHITEAHYVDYPVLISFLKLKGRKGHLVFIEEEL